MPKIPAKRVSTLEEALNLHNAGWWVIPQAGKQAIVVGWNNWRLSEDDLRNYFGNGSKLNVAVALHQSPLMDVECDNEEGEAELQRLLGEDELRTPTWKARRGLHRLYIRPERLPDRAVLTVNGIEFRIGNKSAISTVPPSVHPEDGTVYQWLPGMSFWEIEPQPLPEALVKLLKKVSKKRKSAGEVAERQYVFSEGERRDAINQLGYRIIRSDSSISREALVAALGGENAAHCDPPLPDVEIGKLADDLLGVGERSRTEIIPVPCSSWIAVTTAWRDALEWRGDLERTLAVMLAVAASTSQQGDQLFLQVVGAPGSAKSRMCEAMLTSPKCHRLDKLTGFHSGFKDFSNPDRDFSLLARINHKTLITSEADLLMSQENATELMSQVRKIFDGSSSASYKNRDEDMKYHGLRTPWIMAGTPAMLDRDQSRLGDRFLRVYIDPPTEDVKRSIMRKVGLSALEAVKQESNCSPDSVLPDDLRRAYQLTGGYVDWLRANFTTQVRRLKIESDAVEERCQKLANFTAYMRSRPPGLSYGREPDYEAAKELPSRLQSQFVRLAACLAVTIGVKELGAVGCPVLPMVRRVALDSARGRSLSLAGLLAKHGRAGADLTGLAVSMGESEEKVVRHLAHMARIGAAASFKVTAGHVTYNRNRWKLTDQVQRLYAEVVGNA